MSPDDSRENKVTTNEFPKLTEFESALTALRPQTAAVDREAFFFRAGQAAALRDREPRRSALLRWSWPLAFSCMTAVAVTLLAMLLIRSAPGLAPSAGNTGPTIAADQTAKPPAASDREPLGDDASDRDFAAYSRVRDEVLRHGIDAGLPQSSQRATATVASTAPQPYRELLKRALQEM